MSNVDEILKYKELLDGGIITNEEFEKKKNELLNINTNNDINAGEKTYKKKNTKMKIIIITIAIFLLIICVIGSIYSNLRNQLQLDVGLRQEEVEEAIQILNACGITEGIITNNSEYTKENIKAYNISINNKNCVVLMTILNKKIDYLKMKTINGQNIEEDKYLYKDNEKVATLSDYVTTKSNKTNTVQDKENETVTEGLYTTSNGRFTLVSQQGNTDNYGFITINGEIKNNTNKTYSYVQVTFTLYDASGAQVGTALANINNFEANGTWRFEAIGTGKAVSYKCTDIIGW